MYRKPNAFLYKALPVAKAGEGLGVNTHTEYYLNSPSLMLKAGFKVVRVDFPWHIVETSVGKYDWSLLDVLVSQYTNAGIRVLALLSGNNPVYGYKPGDGLVPGGNYQAFLKFVQLAVSRYKRKNILWELWNEPNLAAFWGPEPNFKLYAQLVRDTRKIFDSIAYTEALVIGALSSENFGSFLAGLVNEDVLKYADAFSFHPYATTPEDSRQYWKDIKAIVKIPIIATEQGFSWRTISTSNLSISSILSDSPPSEAILREDTAEANLDSYQVNIQEGIPITIIYDWPETADQMGLVKLVPYGTETTTMPGYNIWKDFYQNLVSWNLATPT